MKISIRTLAQAFTVAASLVMVLAFQNCTQSVSMSSSGTATKDGTVAPTQLSGNGGTYDGKPGEGKYVRRGGEACHVNSRLIGIMEVGQVNASITNDLCVDMNYAFEFSDSRIAYSGYNPDFIGFNAAIFESAASVAGSLSPTHLWCRHSQSDSGVDLVVKVSGQGHLYRGEGLTTNKFVIYPKQSFPVRTVNNGTTIDVRSSEISGVVDLQSYSNGVYPGRLSFKGTDLAFDCRVLSDEPAVYSAPPSILAMFQMEGKVGPLFDGQRVSDSSVNLHAGNVFNKNAAGAALLSDGAIGQALHLDGHDDYVDFSTVASGVSRETTVSLYLRPAATINDDRVAFAINTAAGSNVIKIGTGMCSGTGDRARLSLEIGGACYDSGRIVVDGLWHKVVVSAAMGGRVTMYLDGNQVVDENFAAKFSPTDMWSLGTDYDAPGVPGDFWSGDLDEVIIWSKAFLATELAAVAAP